MNLQLPTCFSFPLWIYTLHYVFVNMVINNGSTISRPILPKIYHFANISQPSCQEDQASSCFALQTCNVWREQREKRLLCRKMGMVAQGSHGCQVIPPLYCRNLKLSNNQKQFKKKITGLFPNFLFFSTHTEKSWWHGWGKQICRGSSSKIIISG